VSLVLDSWPFSGFLINRELPSTDNTGYSWKLVACDGRSWFD
jgi:hypothetical protein